MAVIVRTLNEIHASDAASVGGKAFNCALLKQAGLSVPDGIVLTTAAMRGSLEIPELQNWLNRLSTNTLLAVRSSAADEDSVAHSFAGIHETRLNVRPEDVPAAVKACWDSVVSPQAFAYRRTQHLPTENVKTAVLIQEMVPAKVSGVAFTINPVTGRKDEFLINSTPGLGDALVSGLVQPDEFRLRKSSGTLLSSQIAGEFATLNTTQLHELAVLLLQIENYFGSPQDVEWCYDGSEFWFVQSRPVTGAASSNGKRDLEWTRANVREVFPDLPPPMTVYSVCDVIENAERRFYGNFLGPESEYGRMIKPFYGRMYFNVDQVRYICRLSSTPPAMILRSLGHEGEIKPEDEIAQKPKPTEALRALPDVARMMLRQLLAKRSVRRQIEHTGELVRHFNTLDFGSMTDAELWSRNRWWAGELERQLQLVFVLAGVSIYEKPLRDICRKVGMAYEPLAHAYLAGGEKSVSAQQAFDLLRLVQIAREEGGRIDGPKFRERFKSFLELYGHRGRYESDFSIPRYVEDPSPLLSAVQAHLNADASPDPDAIIQRQNSEAAKAWKEFEARLTRFQRFTLLPGARWLLKRIKQYYVWREKIRSEMVRLSLPMRKLHLVMAERFVEHGWIQSEADYFYLVFEEIDQVMEGKLDGQDLKDIIVRRKAEWDRFATIDMPLLMRESQLQAMVRRANVSVITNGSSELRGLCVSAGWSEAEVIVLRDPGEISRMKRGAILVTTATDPSWTPLFTLASGIVVEVGGILSHASTVAREYGLPALANVKNATKILKNGDRVRLDATNGVVQILDCGRS